MQRRCNYYGSMKVFPTIVFAGTILLVSCSPYWRCESGACDGGHARLISKYCDVYEGETRNGEPEGMGRWTSAGSRCTPGFTTGAAEGLMYEGPVTSANGTFRFDGEGTLTYPNGMVLGGTFKGHLASPGLQPGSGFFRYGNVDFRGEWVKRKADDREVLMCIQGDCLNGRGIRVSSTAMIVEGTFRNGSPAGSPCRISTPRNDAQGLCSSFWITSGKLSCPPKQKRHCDWLIARDPGNYQYDPGLYGWLSRLTIKN